jgi:hypothetical protein
MDKCIPGDPIIMDNVELEDNNRMRILLNLFQKVGMNYKKYMLLKEYFPKFFHIKK